MSTPIFKAARACTKFRLAGFGLFAAVGIMVATLGSPARADWKVDLSRRQKAVRDADLSAAGGQNLADPPAPTSARGQLGGAVTTMLDGEPTQEFVVLNTERGFVPSALRLRNGSRNTIHVVNVNEKDKNISFVLDAFGEHHATYYGKIKTFRLDPKKDGTYSFQCPETSAEGRLIVYSSGGSTSPTQMRGPASAGFPSGADSQP